MRQPKIRSDSWGADLANALMLAPVYRKPKSDPYLRDDINDPEEPFRPPIPEPKPTPPVPQPKTIYKIHQCETSKWTKPAYNTMVECPTCKTWWFYDEHGWDDANFFEKKMAQGWIIFDKIRKKL